VENYDNKWNVKIFDTKKTLLNTPENPYVQPPDLVPKRSIVTCVIECTGIWIGPKGWGVTWRLNQCVVKPPPSEAYMNECQVVFQPEEEDNVFSSPLPPTIVSQYAPLSTSENKPASYTSDSDTDDPPPPPVEPEPPVADPIVEDEPIITSTAKKMKKKVK
jgi:hypothetical protein